MKKKGWKRAYKLRKSMYGKSLLKVYFKGCETTVLGVNDVVSFSKGGKIVFGMCNRGDGKIEVKV